ncbi:MAG: tetratricopeptide repeat protein [Anaerolineales bacterium]|nr:tetratricopeptide repeat protein [Anaerolineales bacterium]
MDTKLRALLRQGERAMRLGKQQAAEDVFRQAVAEFPKSAQAWLNLGQVVSSEEESASYLERAHQLDPDLVVETEEPADRVTSDENSQSSQLDFLLNQSRASLEQVTESRQISKPEKIASREEKIDVIDPASPLTCTYHPDVETTLRCNRCDKPICLKCAIQTPVGYRCKNCIREQQDVFFGAFWYDYLLAAIVTIPLAGLASYIIFSIGWLTIFIAPFAGLVIAEAVRLVTRRRRGRWLPLVVSVCIVTGSLPGVGFLLIGTHLNPYVLPIGALIWQVVYLFLAVSSAYYRVK